MLEFFKGILEKFIPNEELPTDEYLLRLGAFVAVIIIVFVMAYYFLFGTVLGAKWGLVKVPATDLPNLAHIELRKAERNNWQLLTQLRENDPNVKGGFIAVLYNPSTGNVITADEGDRSQVLIWNFSIPGTRFNSIDIVESAIAKVKPEFRKRFLLSPECYGDKLSGEPLRILRRGIANLKSTHFASCPVYSQSINGKGYLLGATFILFGLPPDELAALVSPTPEKIAEFEAITVWSYQDKLRRTTSQLSDNFRTFTKPYSYYYK